MNRPPKWVIRTIVILGSLALIPPALVARARASRTDEPRIHPVLDMDNQPRFKAQQANPIFADGRAMRPPVPGTVARGELHDDDHYYRGLVNGTWATTFPMPVTEALIRRGQERFNIYCFPCHGLDGSGRGPVAVRAETLQEADPAGTAWTPPLSFHEPTVRQREVGHLFNTITNGIRNMPPYGPHIPPHDRWAIVAYIRALQRSHAATIDDVPPDVRPRLLAEPPPTPENP